MKLKLILKTSQVYKRLISTTDDMNEMILTATKKLEQ